MSELNWFDISVITIISVSTIFAMFRGFIKTCFSLITWVGSGFLTAIFYSDVRSLLENTIENPNLLFAVASLGTFLIIFIIVAIINAYIINLIGNVKGGVIDRSLGFAFGFLRGALLVCLIFFTTSIVSKTLSIGDEKRPGPEWFTSAKTYNTLLVVSDLAVSLLPEGSTDQMIAYIDSVKDIALARIGGDTESQGEGQTAPTKSLGTEERKVMSKIIANIPKADLYRVYKSRKGKSGDISEEERVAIFKDIFEIYLKSATSGEIAEDNLINDAELENLKSIFNRPADEISPDKDTEETGYKDLNIKQLNRLVGTVSNE